MKRIDEYLKEIGGLPTREEDGMTVFDLTAAVGDKVFCDMCGIDYSDSDACGGILFQSKAICPDCSPKWIADAERYNETRFIRDRCPEGMPFAKWVREVVRANR